MRRIEFKGWVLEVDQTATEDAYAEVGMGDALSCGCDDCVRFDNVRLELLPSSVLELFNELKIEPSKEAETTNSGPDDEGRDIWSWWYHFVGRILEVPEDAQSVGHLPSSSLSADFAIGFVEGSSLAHEPLQGRGTLVQVECLYYEGQAAL